MLPGYSCAFGFTGHLQDGVRQRASGANEKRGAGPRAYLYFLFFSLVGLAW
jgi:hypothetical protein